MLNQKKGGYFLVPFPKGEEGRKEKENIVDTLEKFGGLETSTSSPRPLFIFCCPL
jgi:hypothetical protein